MISRCAFLSIGLMAVCLMVASVFAAEAEDGAGGAAKNEARLLVGKHVRYLSLLYLLKLHQKYLSCLQVTKKGSFDKTRFKLLIQL